MNYTTQNASIVSAQIAPPSMSEIDRELDTLAGSISVLDNMADEYVNRLTRITKPAQPEPECTTAKCGPSPVYSPLATNISTLSQRVQNITARLNDANQRLAL